MSKLLTVHRVEPPPSPPEGLVVSEAKAESKYKNEEWFLLDAVAGGKGFTAQWKLFHELRTDINWGTGALLPAGRRLKCLRWQRSFAVCVLALSSATWSLPA